MDTAINEKDAEKISAFILVVGGGGGTENK